MGVLAEADKPAPDRLKIGGAFFTLPAAHLLSGTAYQPGGTAI